MLYKRSYVYIVIRTDRNYNIKKLLLDTYIKLFGSISFLNQPIKFIKDGDLSEDIHIIRCLTKYLPETIYSLAYLILKHEIRIEFLGIEPTLRRVRDRILIFI